MILIKWTYNLLTTDRRQTPCYPSWVCLTVAYCVVILVLEAFILVLKGNAARLRFWIANLLIKCDIELCYQ